MTDDLTKKLKEMVRIDTMGYELDEKVDQITQAFIDAGWRHNYATKSYDRYIKQEKGWMTGQEWYDKFEKELMDVTKHWLFQPFDREKVLEAAKKSSWYR